MATAQTESKEFQAEVRELLRIMIHSLYSHREIFLRELISNASDALDKLRYEVLRNPDLAEPDALRIRLEVDADARVLRVIDNGIGMSRDEVVENLGTIAKSGTKSFLREIEEAQDAKAAAPRLIGQFGVGFYSCFMVAGEVEVVTRRLGEQGATLWRSKGDGAYTLDAAERDQHGTTVTLHLKPVDEEAEGEFHDFAEEWALRQVVRRYSDFVEYPIELDVEREEGEGDERKTVVRTEVLNSMRPLWTRPKADVTEEEHTEFYKHLTHDWEPPLETIHFQAEGAQAYTALLYVPRRRPFDLFDPTAHKSRVALYVRRVHIAADVEELMPVWLRFVRGLVDSDDLPLNISRETLQHNRQVGQIRKRLVKKVLDALAKHLAQDRASYVDFWKAFGPVLKEGVYHDGENREAVADVCLFQSSAGPELTTLREYVERMPADQEAIVYLVGDDRAQLESSPMLESVRAKDWEVLFLTDAVDEFAVERLREYRGKPLRSVESAAEDLESDEHRAAREKKQEEQKDLLEAVRERLDEHVSEVRFSSRLADSAVVLVSADKGLSRAQQRMMREMGQDVPAPKRALELNPDHPIVARLAELRGRDESRFADYCELILGQALLAEGSPLPRPARFAKLLSELMVG